LSLAASLRPIAAACAHGFTGRLSLFIVQLAVAVGIKFLNHLLAHFAVTSRTLLFVLSRRAARDR
jgi:hypothetical protein